MHLERLLPDDQIRLQVCYLEYFSTVILLEGLGILTASESQDAGCAAVEMHRDRPLFLVHQRL